MSKCPYCKKKYKNAKCFSKHFKMCEIIHHTDDESIPQLSRYDMSVLITQLVKDNEILKHKIKGLQRNNRNYIKNINIIDYLNKKIIPRKTYEKWIKNVDMNYNDFEIIVNKSFINGVVWFIQKYNKQNLKAYNMKKYKNEIYGYNGNEWIKIDINKILLYIQLKLLNHLEKLEKKVKPYILNNTNEDEVNFYYKAGKVSTSNKKDIHNKIINQLYNKLKINPNKLIT